MTAPASRFTAATAALVVTLLLLVPTVSVPAQAAPFAPSTVTLPILA